MASRQVPKLMGAAEIQERLGFSRQWTYVIVGRRGFPEPVMELTMGKLWLAEDVETWIRGNRESLAQEPEGDTTPTP